MFVQLPERPAARHIYNLLHRVINDGAPLMETNCRAAQWMLGKYIRDGSLRAERFRKYLPKSHAEPLITRVTQIYDESIRQNATGSCATAAVPDTTGKGIARATSLPERMQSTTIE